MSSTFVVYVEDSPASSTAWRPCSAAAPSTSSRSPSATRYARRVAHDDRRGHRRDGARKVEAHLYKLVNVLRVDDVTSTPAVYRTSR